jgi:hypothetical protein
MIKSVLTSVAEKSQVKENVEILQGHTRPLMLNEKGSHCCGPEIQS